MTDIASPAFDSFETKADADELIARLEAADIGLEDFIVQELDKFRAGEDYDKAGMHLAGESLILFTLIEDGFPEAVAEAMIEAVTHDVGFGYDDETDTLDIHLVPSGRYAGMPAITRSFVKPTDES